MAALFERYELIPKRDALAADGIIKALLPKRIDARKAGKMQITLTDKDLLDPVIRAEVERQLKASNIYKHYKIEGNSLTVYLA